MSALAATLAVLVLASAVPASEPRDVRWIRGPAAVELLAGRVRCALPRGVAGVAGEEARAVLRVVAGEIDGTELAVLAPTEPEHRWYVVVAWEPEGPSSPRRWSTSGDAPGEGTIVNEHVRIPAAGGALRVTLVTAAGEYAEAREHLERILEGIASAEPGRRAER